MAIFMAILLGSVDIAGTTASVPSLRRHFGMDAEIQAKDGNLKSAQMFDSCAVKWPPKFGQGVKLWGRWRGT